MQQQFRSRHARKEVAARRAQLAAEKRRLAAEALKHKQDLAALKIQGMARRWQARRAMKTKLEDRQKEIEAKRQAELDAIEQVRRHTVFMWLNVWPSCNCIQGLTLLVSLIFVMYSSNFSMASHIKL